VADNILGQSALLLPLANNGGPTQTHALAEGSPALNAGIVILGINTDQRGFLRDSGPDIGAYEAQAPELTGTGGITYTENDPATAINPGLEIVGVQVVSGTITITNVVAGQDVLGFTNDGLTMGNIAIASNLGGVLTLTSAGFTATVAEWQAALRAVTYANTSDTPSTTTRSVEFQVSSEFSTSDVLTNTIAVTAVNDVPVAQANSVTTLEDTPLVFALSDFPFSDAEGNSLVSITVTNLNLAAGDTLTVDLGLGAVAVTNGLTITAAQLASLTYTPAANANGLARSTFDFTVNDAGAGTVAATMTINVTAVNDAPVFTSSANFSIAENTTAVGTVIATDVDLPPQTITYSITAGADAAFFSIDPATGALTFNAAPDFETPLDAGGDNVYDITVTANDNAGLTTTQNIAVTVTPVNDNAPVFTSLPAFNVVENATAVGTVTATDADQPAQTINYSITGGLDAALFGINPTTGALVFLAAPDFENPADAGGDNVYNVQVTANDNSGSLVAQDITVTVTNAVESPEITLNPVTGQYHVGKERAFVDPTATFVADVTASDYSQARLTVSISSNRDKRDILSIYAKGSEAGNLQVKGKKLLYNGVEIGKISGGRGKQPDLVIEFNSAATEAILNEVVKHVNFEAKNKRLPQSTRTLQMQVTNVSGLDSNVATRLINTLPAGA
jgi:VCBS repeat-containing protein